ncbi:MAG: helix-turn-helix transcriptional regulator [Anaerolineae bacterium]|jgi:transcriptional regulator with XRE-family HTH domain|nr:helix-turn-helix transcriptional regulator [Anaerolineae bacterium]
MSKNIQELIDNKIKNKAYYRDEAFFRLADAFLLLRKQRGITQTELAKLAGTTQTVVSRLENASVKPSLETIVKLAEAMDAVVDVQLIHFDKIRKKSSGEFENICEQLSQEKQGVLKGISLFDIDKSNEEQNKNWVDMKLFTLNHPNLNISSKPPLSPTGRKKILEYA